MGDEEHPLPPVPETAVSTNIDQWWANKQLLADTENAPTVPLYHYTDANGLLGIIQNQEVWFTNIFHLNDSEEVSYGLGIALDVLRKMSHDSHDPMVKSFCQLFERFVTHKYGELFGFYVTSFSRPRDDLGQWRAYAANGKGYAIGLAPRLFQVVDKPNRKPHEAVFFAPVIYGATSVTARLRELIDRAIGVVTQPSNVAAYNGNNQLAFEFFNRIAIAISSPLLWETIASKHDAYQHENEVRLVILGGRESLQPHIHVRVRGSEYVPFIKSEMLVQEKDAISEIVIGPSAPQTAEDGLRAMLDCYRIDHDNLIARSNIPYRTF